LLIILVSNVVSKNVLLRYQLIKLTNMAGVYFSLNIPKGYSNSKKGKNPTPPPSMVLPILVMYNCDQKNEKGYPLKYVESTGKKIPYGAWSKSVKNTNNKWILPSYQNAESLNDFLTGKKNFIESIINNLQAQGIKTSPETIKEEIKRKENQINRDFASRESKTLLGYIQEKIKEKELTERGILKRRNYHNLKYNLELFAGETVNYEDITNVFKENFLKFLDNKWKEKKESKGIIKAEPLSPNTKAKYISTLKLIMRETAEIGYHKNFSYMKFKEKGQKTDSIFLDNRQLIKLYRHDFSDNYKYEQVRDIFLVMCYTAARVSDYQKFYMDKIIEDERGNKVIPYIPQKTEKSNIQAVYVPVGNLLESILKKYEKLPSYSPQFINETLKTITRMAKLDKPNEITCHTGRRSFCTNAYLAGMSPMDIMKISGHESIEAFMRYIKINSLEVATKASELAFLNNPTILKAVI
jgi:integrase